MNDRALGEWPDRTISLRTLNFPRVRQKTPGLVAAGNGRLRAPTGDGDCGGGIGPCESREWRFAPGERRGERAVEDVAGRGRIDGLYSVRRKRCFAHRTHQDAALFTELQDQVVG